MKQPLECRPTAIAGVVVVEPVVVGDQRGFLRESWRREAYAALGLPREFVQDNVSQSRRNVLRGLHCQEPNGQGKLVQVLAGEILDVAVDVRRGSPTFGAWVGEVLSAANHRQMYLPPGFAHGFCVTSEAAIVAYKCTDYYDPDAEFVVAWNDPALAIPWPVENPKLSPRDAAAPRLQNIPPERLPRFTEPPG